MPNTIRMNPQNQNSIAAKACQIFGGQAAFARALGVSSPTVSQWVSGGRPIPPKRCVAIEQATGGKVTRQELRPHDWADHWPELKATT